MGAAPSECSSKPIAAQHTLDWSTFSQVNKPQPFEPTRARRGRGPVKALRANTLNHHLRGIKRERGLVFDGLPSLPRPGGRGCIQACADNTWTMACGGPIVKVHRQMAGPHHGHSGLVDCQGELQAHFCDRPPHLTGVSLLKPL